MFQPYVDRKQAAMLLLNVKCTHRSSTHYGDIIGLLWLFIRRILRGLPLTTKSEMSITLMDARRRSVRNNSLN